MFFLTGVDRFTPNIFLCVIKTHKKYRITDYVMRTSTTMEIINTIVFAVNIRLETLLPNYFRIQKM